MNVVHSVGRRCCAAGTDAQQRVPTNEFRAHGGAALLRRRTDARQRVPTNEFRALGRAALLRRRDGRAAARPYQ
jgi:hypothetical protein